MSWPPWKIPRKGPNMYSDIKILMCLCSLKCVMLFFCLGRNMWRVISRDFSRRPLLFLPQNCLRHAQNNLQIKKVLSSQKKFLKWPYTCFAQDRKNNITHFTDQRYTALRYAQDNLGIKKSIGFPEQSLEMTLDMFSQDKKNITHFKNQRYKNSYRLLPTCSTYTWFSKHFLNRRSIFFFTFS